MLCFRGVLPSADVGTVRVAGMASGQIAAFVLHWGDPELTRRCVDSIRAQEPSIPVLVVANDDRWTASAQGDVEVIGDGTNRGYAGGMNLGLRSAIDRGFEFVALVTNDGWFPDSGVIESLTEVLAKDDRIAVCGPRLLRRGADGAMAAWSVGPGPYPHRAPSAAVLRPAGLPEGLVGVAWLEGSCWVARTSAIRDVGGFDERLFMYFEDNDWCYRALLRGWYVCRDDRVAFCEEMSASASSVSGLKDYYMTRNRLIVGWRYRGIAQVARDAYKAARRSAGYARRRDPRWRWIAEGLLDFCRHRTGMNRKLHGEAARSGEGGASSP
jgi:GT2 family glycosyltransferase